MKAGFPLQISDIYQSRLLASSPGNAAKIMAHSRRRPGRDSSQSATALGPDEAGICSKGADVNYSYQKDWKGNANRAALTWSGQDADPDAVT